MPRNLRNKEKILFSVLILVILGFLLLILSSLNLLPHLNFVLFDPKGAISVTEKNAIIVPFLLMLIVVIPVLTAAVWVARKYRADNNENAEYQPDWTGSRKLEFLWWAFPGIIILCLCVLTWRNAHAVDPYKELKSENKAITIEVVALNWKWLFIYPEQNIATVNFVEFPENTPINFVLTADAPMNSFWIPQLGSQMYAMPGMATQLHLIANEQGEFNGSAVEINGPGYSGMNFKAKAVSAFEFGQWLNSVRQSPDNLTGDVYAKLAEPSAYNPAAVYASADSNLFDYIMKKYMAPEHNMPGMDMSMPMEGNK